MDNTIPHNFPKLARLFSQHIHTHPFHLDGTDSASVLEWLYLCYTESQERDPPEIDQIFRRLDTHLEQLPLDENNAIFAIICNLCNAYEKRAFLDAIKLGAYYMLELQER